MGPVETATLARLVDAGRESTPDGAAALILAARLDRAATSVETGSAVASLAREHRATMSAALAGVERSGDGVDELQERRRAKLAAAG